jgi:predicted RNA-binding protein
LPASHQRRDGNITVTICVHWSGWRIRIAAKRPVVFDERKMTFIVGRIEMKRERCSLETDEYHINHVRDRIAGKI